MVVAQFLKSGAGGEGKAVERFPEITLLRTKGVNKFTFQMNDDEKAETAENCLSLFRQAVELARRLTLCANHLLDESSVPEDLPEQIDLFTDYSAKEKQKKDKKKKMSILRTIRWK